MYRRDFLRSGAQTAAVGAAALISDQPSFAAVPASGAAATASILKAYTVEDHRRRLENIGACKRGIQKCLRKHLVTNYLPGQCCYNLGEYPCTKPWDPGEYDERELDRLQAQGIRLLQVFDDWNDSLRLFGGDKYTALNPAGFRRFVELAHRRGMKVLAYCSTGFLQWTDPDFRQDWSPLSSRCSLGFWDMARCVPASPGWRAFLLPRLMQILDRYGADGLYIDGGYITNAVKAKLPDASPLKAAAKDEMAAFDELPTHDGALADLLALIYAEVKRRGGILKLHIDGALQPQTGDLKVYDYLWVGEGVGNADNLRETVKNYGPYVVPCIDMSFAKTGSEEEPYLHAIPYLQFPVLQAGRPYTGQRGMIPGVRYVTQDDFWMRRCREVWKYHQQHPHGPHVYGSWDAVPPRGETQATHARWLKQYLPMVEEGTWAWLEISQSNLFAGPLPTGVVASAFANRRLYLVLANYTKSAAEVTTTQNFIAMDAPTAAPSKQWRLPPRSLRILRHGA
jgi:hypothetical protein